jgi:GNAT superfamily N-acetyltransferase
MDTITLRSATSADRPFIDGLSSRFSSVPHVDWHDRTAMEGFQARHTAQSFAPAEGSETLVACAADGERLGYIHLKPGRDGVTDEPCGYISLIATTKEAEGTGVATRLMAAAEDWARGRGYRLLSLDVFADNRRAVDFYRRGGFKTETRRMVKPL